MKYFVLWLIAYSTTVYASQKTIDVTVNLSDGFPVYYYDKTSKEFLGPMVDSFKAICKEANLNCKFKSVPKKRIEADLVSGKINFGSVINSKTQQKLLKGSVYFTEYNMPANLGMYSSLPEGQIPTDLKSYFGKEIICVRGWSLSILPGVWEAEKEGKLKIYKPTTIKSATKMLLEGRAEFLYANKQKMDVFITPEDKVYFKEFKSLNQTFGLSKNSENYKEIKARVDKAISNLFSNGMIDKKTGRLLK
ncbi:substrate-binding periplasmic protein [Vibrio marisflavi]|uniref:Solute-binding protein family 3/N-terminal domain-containing protein n=1 Tax=Vibrio marisflavi CECT 7928 TaxID=634439 RepID=A0ABN8E3J2_9VIBR|nr:transporter substrate-binding domain-containing protein [Vibrio marisflavi]CAH0539833.1 hypothetical protein VMF7928_02481 [Vibrio marisflavi CECT 7928]